ncbi:MAG: exosortase/archaeosortase family protein, partial [Candidatus Omnitrophica bacterium]|nr:exosortase/archaeosortase family protein [Candidatus Omnitrophota bacterium]
KLKIMATQAAVFLVNLIGIEAVRAGSAINYPGGQLMVGDPCSGLRSLITFLALGALFTQFTNASALRRGTLFISTIPIALFSNFIRLAFLVLVGFIYGEKAATGFLHDSSGLLVFVLGFFGLVMVSKVLRCRLCAETI